MPILRDDDQEDGDGRRLTQLELFWDGELMKRPPLISENGRRPPAEAAEAPMDWEVPPVHAVPKG